MEGISREQKDKEDSPGELRVEMPREDTTDTTRGQCASGSTEKIDLIMELVKAEASDRKNPDVVATLYQVMLDVNTAIIKEMRQIRERDHQDLEDITNA